MGDPHPRGLLLTAADFDAFLESFALPALPAAGAGPARTPAKHRHELRSRIAAWARTVVPRLQELGLATEVVVPDEVEQHLSSRAPRAISQRVVFLRDAFARALLPPPTASHDPLRSHAYLALTIDSVHLALSLELCPEAEADVKNLRARIADPSRLLELTTMLETLPEEFAIGVIGVPSFPRAQSATADEVRALLDDSQRSGRPLWIGWSIKREIALSHSEELEEQLGDALVALAHAYKLVAWAQDNDLIAASRRGMWRAGRARAAWPGPGSRSGRRQEGGAVDDERERNLTERRTRRKVRKGPVRVEGSRREREDARRHKSVAGRTPENEGRTRKSDRDEPPVTDAKDDDKRGDARPVPPRRPILQTTLRARGARSLSAKGDTDPRAPVEKGTKVRVLAGPFANKVGVVQELDGKGRARVRLGLLGATLDLKDLAASVEGQRPMLGSSHRRPRGGPRGK